jgi:hypothetical protein
MCAPTTLDIPARFLGGVALQSNSMIYLVHFSHLSCPHLTLKTPRLASTTSGASHTVALPITLKNISRQKKNYGNSNISPYKNIIFQNSSKRNPNPSRYYNSVTNLKFQHKPNYHLSKVSSDFFSIPLASIPRRI